MPVIKYGYSGGTKTLEQFAVWSGWVRLHPEMKRRVMALIVDSNYILGVGSSFRTAAQQIALWKSRYTRVSYATQYFWDGSYWIHTSGAPAGKPGDSYHEPCIGLDGKPDSTDATGYCVAVDTLDLQKMPNYSNAFLAKYGLRNFDIEPWHIQPIEWPAARKNWNTSPLPLKTWQLPGTTPTPVPQPIPTEDDDMLKLIRPKADAAVFLLDGLVCTWVQNGNILNALQPISSLALIEVDRLSLKALELHGPVPWYGPETPVHQPERTIASHFAVHRP